MSNGRASVKYTYEDLQTFPEGDRKRYEIIDGDLLVTPSPMSRHQLILGTLHWWIRSYLETVKVYRKTGGRFDRPIGLSSEAGDTLTTPRLPGFEAPLAKLFA